MEHCPNCGGSLEDHRRHRRSAGDCQNPRPSGPTDPRPAPLPCASIRSIPNDPNSQNRLPTRADGAARSEFERAASIPNTSRASRPLLRPSRPIQHWVSHQTERKLTTLLVLRYSSGHKKGGLNFLYSQMRRAHKTTSLEPRRGRVKACSLILCRSLGFGTWPDSLLRFMILNSTTFAGIWSSWQWRPIRNCPGRFQLVGVDRCLPVSALIGVTPTTLYQVRKARDSVLVGKFVDGGLISYVRVDWDIDAHSQHACCSRPQASPARNRLAAEGRQVAQLSQSPMLMVIPEKPQQADDFKKPPVATTVVTDTGAILPVRFKLDRRAI